MERVTKMTKGSQIMKTPADTGKIKKRREKEVMPWKSSKKIHR